MKHSYQSSVSKELLRLLAVQSSKYDQKSEKYLKIKLGVIDKLVEQFATQGEDTQSNLVSMITELTAKYYLMWDGKELLLRFLGRPAVECF